MILSHFAKTLFGFSGLYLHMSLGVGFALSLYRRNQGSDPTLDVLSQIDGTGDSAGLYYFDPNVCPTYQDTAGTVLAVAENDPVARIDDYYGNGWSFRQGTGSLQPKLTILDGRRYIEHVSDVLTLSTDPNLDMGDTGSGQGSGYGFHMQDFHNASDTTTYTYMGGDDTGINNNRVLLRRENDFAGSFQITTYSPLTPPSLRSQYVPAQKGAKKVIRIRNKFNLPDRGIPIWENAVLVNNQAGNNSGSYDLNALHLGQRDGGTEIHPGFRWSAFFWVDRVNCDDTAVDALEAHLITLN